MTNRSVFDEWCETVLDPSYLPPDHQWRPDRRYRTRKVVGTTEPQVTPAATLRVTIGDLANYAGARARE